MHVKARVRAQPGKTPASEEEFQINSDKPWKLHRPRLIPDCTQRHRLSSLPPFSFPPPLVFETRCPTLRSPGSLCIFGSGRLLNLDRCRAPGYQTKQGSKIIQRHNLTWFARSHQSPSSCISWTSSRARTTATWLLASGLWYTPLSLVRLSGAQAAPTRPDELG